MTSSDTKNARLLGSWIKILLLPFALLLLTAAPALAEDCVKDLGGVVNGFVNPVPPSQIKIDGNCTIKNFPASNPMSTNFSFLTQPGQTQQRWLVVFDNVVHTGQMSCNSVAGHKIWFTNGSSTGIHAGCQNLLIPVEKIDKQNPAGQTTAAIGVPFTYKLTSPVLFDPATGTVSNANGSPNDLHSITMWDDLNATGASLSYVSHTAYWKSTGAPIPHTFSNVGGFLTFDNFPVVPAFQQFVIELTVVLNNTPANAPGTQFRNTAKWDFGRLIDGTFYEPLPGEWGISPPMTIAAPVLVVAKSGPATMNLGQWGDFVIDAQNTGLSDAWNTTIRDRLPDGATGGMCDLTPEILSVQVFAADGVTPAPGKGPLSLGSGYSRSYSAAPSCQLDITLLTAAGRIGPNERLIIRYRTQLDSNTQNGIALTNVAGAIEWFNGDSSNPNRVAFNRTLTNGTPSIQDHEDDHTVTTALTGYFFDKTVADVTSGVNPATTAGPGDTLRYTLRFRTLDQALTNVRIFDDLDALNAPAAFMPGTLALVTYPPGANISNTSGTGGTKGTGVIDVRNLNLPINSEVLIEFTIRLATTLANGTVVTNQSALRLANGTTFAVSDNPNVNGTASPTVSGDEDPTRVTIVSAPAFRVQKISTDLTGDPNVLVAGETLRYTITAKNIGNVDAVNVTLRDAVPANTTYVAGSTTMNGAAVADVGGVSPLVAGMLINSPANATPGSMPADASTNPSNVATITFNVVVNAATANGTVISNQGFLNAPSNGIVDQPSDDPDTPTANDPTRDTVVSNSTFRVQKISTDLTGDPAVLLPGETLRYTITAKNIGTTDAANVTLRDAVPANTTYVAGSTTMNGAAVADIGGVSPLVAGMLINSPANATPGSMPADASTNPANVATLTFNVVVNAATANGTVISNQGFVNAPASGIVDQPSDDPDTPTANDPTRDTVVSAPLFRVQKISTDLTGDPNVLLPGETLRYTITAKNIGNVDAANVTLRDAVPANTTYVAGSTTMNGAAVADIGGVSPLVAGMLINSPANATPGTMPADASTNPANVATLTFNVVVNTATANGTVISNQGFVSAPASGIVDQPSDDPDTPAANDPTRDTVVSAPLFRVQKISTDLTGDPNILLPGETLRYTITAKNIGNVDAANVTLRDAVPANTTYVAGSTTMNGAAVADIGGVSPLVAGMLINSPANATPGTMPADASTNPANVATITFNVVVNTPTANGTVISNQGFVSAPASGIVDQPSDDPDTPAANDPTRDTVGSGPAFRVQKISTDLTGDPNVLLPGETLSYTITAKNIGTSDAANVMLRDAVPANTTYVAGSTTMNGAAVADVGGVSPLVAGMLINSPANATPGSMPADASTNPANVATITFNVVVNATVAGGTVISNQGFVSAPASGIVDQPSDDPDTPTANDPTRDTVASAPLFRVQKISTDVTGDPSILFPGETLRYTITTKNIGTADAANVMLRDAVPANTTYVAGSTTMNGAAVADVGGVSPLVAGMLINSPANATPGSMPADASTNPANVATLTFNVVVNAVANGTVISNQGFVSASGIIDQPSDDPDTPAANDPTRDTVVSAPVFRVQKISTDLAGDPNFLLPGETLRYTITAKNIGNVDGANVTLRDAVPANTTYVAGSTTMNGAAVADIGGVSPLVAGMLINSPANATPGSMPADASTNPANVATITFSVVVNAATANGTVISNQGFVSASGITDQPSDDPDSPALNDPTRDTVGFTPAFRVQKISTDLTGDPNVLLPGETLRYTITAKNISTADALNVMLRDAVPANTTYVAGSTTMNGAAVADVSGVSPLVAGMLINSPANATPGTMPADASTNPANVSTITFNVVVNANAANGTVISNQGFVSAPASGIIDQPSDDPDTPTANDPTRDIVGNLPLLYAEKRAALTVDLGSPGVVDPGDVLRYTITVRNSAAISATGVVLRDGVPANTTYVANSTSLNGTPVGQPDGGVSPLASGITIGTVSSGAVATLQFDLRVNAGTPAGTLISNQAVVSSTGLPNLLTDGDGNPATGPEPTVVAVGAAQQLSISKQVTVVGGGAAVPGAQLEYVVRVENIAAASVINVVITDDLNASQPGQLAYVSGSATVNSSAAGVTFAGSTITANYSGVNGPLAPGGVVVLRFRATLAANLTVGTAVTNTGVVAWNNPTQTASASVSIIVGTLPGFAVLNGVTWHDADFDNVRDSGERALAGWTVELYRDNQLSQSVLTDANGVYRIIGVEPNDQNGVRYELRFHAPGAGANTAMLGRTDSSFTNGLQRITDIIATSAANLQGLNLPIHPNGVVYNSVARIPVAGATLTLMDAGSASPLPASCFDDAAQQGQITLADGYYKFDVNFSDPACPSGGDYLIGLTAPPGTTYISGYSQIIPPTSGASSAAFSVPACPASVNDAIPGTTLFCEVQPSEFAPAASVVSRSAGTIYHVHLMLDSSQIPGSSQIFNNHIALDPALAGTIAISKTTPMLNVSRGQQVPYVITVNNSAGTMLTDVSISDQLPAGFTYVVGSAILDGVPTEPSVAGRTLSWNGLVVAGTQARTVKLLLIVGAGNAEGEYVNRAQATNGVTGSAMSGEATATVRVVPDATFDCTDVTGKVFKDANRNGVQDDGEEGLPGVRVVTATGLQATTDQYGRYHITCAITPHESRGSNFVLKLDDRTLPGGFRLTTDQVQIKRATRGKALRLNFGASIHRVISIDLSDAVFEPGTTDIRVQWRPRINMLLEELRKAPAVLRLSYVADTEEAALVERRVQAIKRQLTDAWDPATNYVLAVEREVFWRRGAPPKRPDVRLPESKGTK